MVHKAMLAVTGAAILALPACGGGSEAVDQDMEGALTLAPVDACGSEPTADAIGMILFDAVAKATEGDTSAVERFRENAKISLDVMNSDFSEDKSGYDCMAMLSVSIPEEFRPNFDDAENATLELAYAITPTADEKNADFKLGKEMNDMVNGFVARLEEGNGT